MVSSSVTSFSSHTPRTLSPGGRRESQEMRNPEMTGNRLSRTMNDTDIDFVIIVHTLPELAKLRARTLELPITSLRQLQEQLVDLQKVESPKYRPTLCFLYHEVVIKCVDTNRKGKTWSVNRVASKRSGTDENPIRASISFHEKCIIVCVSDDI